MTHAAPATAALRAIDVASAVKESLTQSQIVKNEVPVGAIAALTSFTNPDRATRCVPLILPATLARIGQNKLQA
jgi:hypothetical protein